MAAYRVKESGEEKQSKSSISTLRTRLRVILEMAEGGT